MTAGMQPPATVHTTPKGTTAASAELPPAQISSASPHRLLAGCLSAGWFAPDRTCSSWRSAPLSPSSGCRSSSSDVPTPSCRMLGDSSSSTRWAGSSSDLLGQGRRACNNVKAVRTHAARRPPEADMFV